MKKLNKCVFVLFLITGFMLTSCSSDDSDENFSEESTEDYWPTAVGNEWNLDRKGTETTIKIIDSKKANGDIYYKFDQFFEAPNADLSGYASIWIKKSNGEYYIKFDDINYTTEGITSKITGYEIVFFKDNLDVNKTWTGSFTQNATFDYPDFPMPSIKVTSSYTGTILEKGLTEVIKNVTYKDVIKFKMVQVSKMDNQDPQTLETEYWIAKNVGIIRIKTGGSVSELTSYVKK